MVGNLKSLLIARADVVNRKTVAVDVQVRVGITFQLPVPGTVLCLLCSTVGYFMRCFVGEA
jgi:hypothetical protein